MSKMKELATVLDELVTCGETLISTANSLREIFSTEAPTSDDEAKATEKSSAEKQPSGTPPAAKGRKKSAFKEEAPESGGLTDAAYQEESNKPEKSITKEEVRGILAAKSGAGYSDEVRALLAKYGAKQLKQVDPKDYAALINDAEAIGDQKAEVADDE